MIPDPGLIMHDETFTCGDHLICDLDKQRGHPFRGVVILRNTVNHSNGIHQTGDVLNHVCLQSKHIKTVTSQYLIIINLFILDLK